MTGHIRTTRPATAAIAAVLALSATPLLAQEIAPATAPAPAPQQTTAQQAAPATAVTASQTAAPAPTQSARTDQALLWAMGGGALLLLGLGGAAMMRRRRPLEEDALAAPMAVDAPDAAPPADTAPIRPAGVAPAMAGRDTRADALASRPTAPVPADATLDAMVAAPPSADNPFTTRVKRTRRARFLLAQREAALRPQPAPSTTRTDPAPTQAQDRSQTVYRFGGDRPRAGFLKPSTR